MSGGTATFSSGSAAMASTGVSSTTQSSRKFSDKIKAIENEQAKQTAEFEKIMRETKEMTHGHMKVDKHVSFPPPKKKPVE